MDQISEALADKIETAFYKCRVIELEARIAHQVETANRDSLINQARVEVGADPDQPYNLDTRTFGVTAKDPSHE